MKCYYRYSIQSFSLLLCLFFTGCVTNIKQGIHVPLTPENRSEIHTIGILVKESPFVVSIFPFLCWTLM